MVSQLHLSERVSNELSTVGMSRNSAPMIGILRPDEMLDPSVMLRKGIYDKVAAKVVLQKYLDFYQN